MPRQKPPREPSSDASLWDDLDDADGALAQISTPQLRPSDRCDLNIDSAPFKTDSSDSALHHSLELELFASSCAQTCRSNFVDHSQPLRPPSSFDFGPVGVGEPWSQPEARTTQHQRDEWLISVGQKEPTDLVEDHITLVADAKATTTSPLSTRLVLEPAHATAMAPASPSVFKPASASASASSVGSQWTARAHSGNPEHPSAARKRSSLLDQLDEICGSSPSNMNANARPDHRHKSSQESVTGHVRSARLKALGPSHPIETADPMRPTIPTGRNGKSPRMIESIDDQRLDASVEDACQADHDHDRLPLRPTISARVNCIATPVDHASDEFDARDVLDLSSSPPSQQRPRITLIKDMPPERQEIYRRLAFGNSASNALVNIGTTVRGQVGKTWQTTWQGNADNMDTSNVRAGTSGNNTSPADTSCPSTAIGRGFKSTDPTSATRQRARGGKARSSSSSGGASSRGRSRFFATRPRGARRGRGRGR